MSFTSFPQHSRTSKLPAQRGFLGASGLGLTPVTRGGRSVAPSAQSFPASGLHVSSGVGRTPAANMDRHLSSTAMLSSKRLGRNVVFSDERNVVEVYAPYPAAVMKGLASAGQELPFHSARADNATGLAWLLANRRIYVWRCNNPKDGVAVFDLEEVEDVNDARLICVVSVGEMQTGLLVVSRSGRLKFWRDATNPSAGVAEASIALPGGDVVCLLCEAAPPVGVVVATNAATLYQIVVGTDAAVGIRGPLVKLGGVLAGLASWFRLSEAPALPRAVVAGETGGHRCSVYVLTEGSLQKWSLGVSDQESFLWETPLRDAVRQALIAEADSGGAQTVAKANLKVWLCDMQLGRGGLLILAASTLASPGEGEVSVMNYAIFFIDEQSQPPSVVPMASLIMAPDYEVDSEFALLEEIRLDAPQGGPTAYVTTVSGLEVVSLKGGSSHVVRMHSNALGSATLGSLAIVFPGFPESNLIAATSVQTDNEPKESQWQPTSMEDLDTVDSKCDILKRAFVAFCRGDDIVAPITVAGDGRPCVLVSSQFLDEPPLSDSRWAEDKKDSSGTILLRRQLEEKFRRHSAFLEFIGNCNKFPLVFRWTLMQHGERIVAAIALRDLQNQAGSLLSRQVFQAMSRVVHRRGAVDEHGVMGPVDLFFVEVTRIEDIFESLQEIVSQVLDGAADVETKLNTVLAVSEVLDVVLSTARSYRVEHAREYSMPEWGGGGETLDDAMPALPLPWTATPPVVTVLSSTILSIRDQLSTNIMGSAGYTDGPAGPKASLLTRLFALSLHLLDALRSEAVCHTAAAHQSPSSESHAAAQKAGRAYEDAREDAIRPFIAYQDYAQALALAEEHRYYVGIVEILEVTGDSERLEGYVRKFADDDFATHMFQWYLAHGQRVKLLNQPPERSAALRAFLASIPHLSWVHALGDGDYLGASVILQALAVSEDRFLPRKKTLLSLAKLGCMAGEGVSDALPQIEDALYLIRAQELLQGQTDLVPLSAEELVALCVGEPRPGHEDTAAEDIRDRHVLAHEIVEKSATVLGPEREEALRRDAWRRTLQADDWGSLAGRRASGEVDDVELEKFLRSTLLFHVLLQGPGGVDGFNEDMRRPTLAAAGLMSDTSHITATDSAMIGLVETAVQLAREQAAGTPLRSGETARLPGQATDILDSAEPSGRPLSVADL